MGIRLYHRTDDDAAEAILTEGFRDGRRGIYFVDGKRVEGVFLATFPPGICDGAEGDVLLAVDVEMTDDELAEFAVEEGAIPVWQYLFPADVLNKRATVRRMTNEEEDTL